MSNNKEQAASTSNADAIKVDEPQKEKEALPQLGALEEDDEFEEFPTQDWEDSETDLTHINTPADKTGAGGSGTAGDNLWEDNWDDDDIEDDFSKQLRGELAKPQSGDQPMSH